jgi:predicted dehydrogenase
MAGGGLRAVVIGAGWAGEGHTIALQHAGVAVEALCARDPGAVRVMAERLGVPRASTDWRATVRELRPDLVGLATPAALRAPVVDAAVALGAHILCEKPLAVDGAEAGRLYHRVADAGLKHAYAATHVYDPSFRWLAELVRDGAVGTLREIVWTLRMDPSPPRSWGWSSRLATGGGLLNNGLTHMLGILETVVGAPAVRAMGEARVVNDRAPVLPMVYGPTGRKAPAPALSPEQATRVEWREVDADHAFTALLRFPARETEVHATVALSRGVAIPGEANARLRLYGDTGTLVVDSFMPASGVFRVAVGASGGYLEPLPTPPRLQDELPAVGDDVQRKWCRLANDFLADIRGEPYRPYLTFRDGWRYQVAIDAIRAGRGWVELPA